MAGRRHDPATYQTDYLTNGGARETFEAYSSLVCEDVRVTRCRYAALVAVFSLNLLWSLGVLCFVAVRGQQPASPAAAAPRCWRPVSKSHPVHRGKTGLHSRHVFAFLTF